MPTQVVGDILGMVQNAVWQIAFRDSRLEFAKSGRWVRYRVVRPDQQEASWQRQVTDGLASGADQAAREELARVLARGLFGMYSDPPAGYQAVA